MKKMYVAPEVELVEIAVEQGFAVSDFDGDELPGYDREEM
jgi:hypothetical protein